MGLGKKKKGGDEGSSAEGVSTKKQKSNLVPAIVVAVGLVAGAKMMGGGGSSPSSVNDSATESTTTTTLPEGERVKLDPITLNVNDGRFLKVGIALQLKHGAKVEGGEGKADNTIIWAKALDLTIEVLGGQSYDDLVTPDGREHAKELLLQRLETAYHGDVEGLYFTEFVMQ